MDNEVSEPMHGHGKRKVAQLKWQLLLSLESQSIEARLKSFKFDLEHPVIFLRKSFKTCYAPEHKVTFWSGTQTGEYLSFRMI